MDNYFNQLVLNKIYVNLPLIDLKNCSQVNKKFNKAFEEKLLWDFLLRRDYDISTNDLTNMNNKKIIYLVPSGRLRMDTNRIHSLTKNIKI